MSVQEKDHLRLIFHTGLRALLQRPLREVPEVRYRLDRKASIKDIVEALGVVHTEVGAIVRGGEELGFDYLPEPGERFEIQATSSARPPTVASPLRPSPLDCCRFMVDGNVAALARLLRMAGFDATLVPGPTKRDSARACAAEGRILLSRDRELLKHREVVFGRLVRRQRPSEQLGEIIDLYDLKGRMAPFSRCMKCNQPLVPVAKETILDHLEPLTRRYYFNFMRCHCCSSIYWQGSHHQHMQERMRHVLQGGQSL